MISRKDKIYDYVKLHTKEMIDTHSLENSGSDALSIALDLKLDRTNVSRELNTLWKEGRLIKLQGRPTLYLDCEALKTEYPNHYIPLTVSAGSSLLDFIQKPQKTQKRELPFHKTALDAIIGSAGSLKNETAQVLAAISYPSGGLPVLLVGSAGVGKRKFAESLFLYSQETGVFDENARFIIINCQDYAHSEERLMLQLLGHTKTSAPGARSAKGLLDAANKGIVYFDGLHKLPSKSIDLVIDLLKNSAYTRVGENRPRPLEAVIMASVRDNLDADFMDTLRSNFPIAVSLPDFYRRSSQEKIEMILDLVTREAYSIHKNIRLDKSVLTAFALPHYPRNESQLRSEIQSACSKAFVEPKNQDACFLTITFDHLSDFVLSAANTCPDDNHAFIRTLALYKNNSIICESNGHCDALDFYKELPLSSDESTSDGAAGSDSPSADARPSLLIVCHGHATASDMQAYTAAQAAQAHVLTAAIDYTGEASLNSLLLQICDAARRLNRGAGVLILADMEPITGLEASVQRRLEIPCRILPSVTLAFLMDCIDKCASGLSLDQFASPGVAPLPPRKELSQEEFINHLVNDILSRTLLYVNPKKATDVLLYSLNTILDQLGMQYSQEIAVKYLSHGVHMLERIIKNVPLPYYQLRQFTNTNHQLMDTIAQSLNVASDTFGVSIPSSEIAYLAEIFLAERS